MEIKNITQDNFHQVAEIYRQGIATGFATFQNDIPTWEDWDKSHASYCQFAAYLHDEMVGWAALTPVSSRCVYAGVAEVSIYINSSFRGKGIGYELLQYLIAESEKAGIWTLQSGIFPQNIGSIALHEKCGFRQIGYREKIGQKNGVWTDNIIMEKRSKTVGVS